jgi:hypothetical protein
MLVPNDIFVTSLADTPARSANKVMKTIFAVADQRHADLFAFEIGALGDTLVNDQIPGSVFPSGRISLLKARLGRQRADRCRRRR